jgi:hypothetical protein
MAALQLPYTSSLTIALDSSQLSRASDDIPT